MHLLFNRATLALFNAVAAALQRLGLLTLPLEPAALKAQAARRAGLADFGPADFEQGLSVACRSFDEDADLSPFGRIGAREVLVNALICRLRYIDAAKAHPPGAPLNNPIFIVGLPRSGTTLLHRLLADFPELRALRTWELADPLSPEPEAKRRAIARMTLSLMRGLAPGVETKHVLDADAAEEEVSLFHAGLWTPGFWRFGAAHSYLRWYQTQDPTPGYQVLRYHLERLQAQTPDRRLVLKLPNHTGFVDVLRAVIPEACLIQTHRDPAPVLGSYLSLTRSIHGIGAQAFDAAGVGATSLQLWAWHAQKNLSARATLPEGALLDVSFKRINEDLYGVLREVCDHAGLVAPPDLEARLQPHTQRDSRGAHSYELEHYGLDTDAVRARFDGYIQRFVSG